MNDPWVPPSQVVDVVNERGTVAHDEVFQWAGTDQREIIIGLRRADERRQEVQRLAATAADTFLYRVCGSDGFLRLAQL